jgi:hypothetical protein
MENNVDCRPTDSSICGVHLSSRLFPVSHETVICTTMITLNFKVSVPEINQVLIVNGTSDQVLGFLLCFFGSFLPS